MRVAGVFIGLSAQEDVDIRALGFGARDAERLHAAFADANEANGAPGGLLHLLTNEAATRNNVCTAIESVVEAAQGGRCDVIHVHFSGHGTPNGQLVLYDTLRADIPQTSLPLGWVSEVLSRSSNVDVVVTLDSCFSGTVLGLPDSPNELSFAQLMRDLTGDARAVVWAAGGMEPAYEAPALGHGYLTYGLVSALEAARSTSQTTVPMVNWLQGAIERAQEMLERDGYPQNPGAYLMTRAGALVPIPPVGPRQHQFAVDDGIHQVTDALASLEVYGFTAAEFTAIERRLGTSTGLNSIQVQAIGVGGVLSGASVLVRAPTTAGKTLVGELAILQQRRRGRKAVVLAPLRALVSEHAAAFREAYGPLGIRVVQSTGDYTDDDDLLLANQFDVAFLTYEKFAAMLGLRPRILDCVGVVVADEIQLVGDEHRGASCELLLLKLRNRQLRGLPQLVALCGELADIGSLDTWLGLRVVGPVPRPVPLREGVLTPDGTFTFVHSDGDGVQRVEAIAIDLDGLDLGARADQVRRAVAVGLARTLVRQGKRVLVFASTQWRALAVAADLAKALDLPPHQDLLAALATIPDGDHHRTTKGLLNAAARGVGLHTAALDSGERLAVEQAFRAGSLRVVVATATLAMGVNTPADAVIVLDTEYWRGASRPPDVVDGLVCRNMAGRAGRVLPNGPAEGSAYLIAHDEAEGERLWDLYFGQRTFSLRSRLEGLDPADRFVSLLGVAGDASLQDVVDLCRHTLLGVQQGGDSDWLLQQRRDFERVLGWLVEGGIILQTGGKIRLTGVGRVASTLILRTESVRRVRNAVQAISASGEPFDALTLLVLAQLVGELDEVYVPATIAVPAQATITGKGQLFEGRIVTFRALVDATGIPGEDPETVVAHRFRRFAGVLDWLRGRPLADLEERYSGEGASPVLNHLRTAASRTDDVLLGVAAIVAAERPDLEGQLRGDLPRLRARLEVGGSAEAGRLLRLRLGLSRRQCLQLVEIGIGGLDDLLAALHDRPGDVERIVTSQGLHSIRAQLQVARNRPHRERGPDRLLLDTIAAAGPL